MRMYVSSTYCMLQNKPHYGYPYPNLTLSRLSQQNEFCCVYSAHDLALQRWLFSICFSVKDLQNSLSVKLARAEDESDHERSQSSGAPATRSTLWSKVPPTHRQALSNHRRTKANRQE